MSAKDREDEKVYSRSWGLSMPTTERGAESPAKWVDESQCGQGGEAGGLEENKRDWSLGGIRPRKGPACRGVIPTQVLHMDGCVCFPFLSPQSPPLPPDSRTSF